MNENQSTLPIFFFKKIASLIFEESGRHDFPQHHTARTMMTWLRSPDDNKTWRNMPVNLGKFSFFKTFPYHCIFNIFILGNSVVLLMSC